MLPRTCLPCEKPLTMLLLHFSEAAYGRLEPRATRRCGAGAGCESITEQLDQRVRNIITHRHFLELASRRIGRHSS